MNKKNVNRKDLLGKWTVGLVFLAGLSVSAVWGQEKWKTYVKGPGATYVVGCIYNVSPTMVTVPPYATGTNNYVEVNVSTHGSCRWTASTGVAWLSLQVGANNANTVRIYYSALNENDPPRYAEVNIAGNRVLVFQQGFDASVVTVAQSSIAIDGKGGYALQGIHALPTGTAVHASSVAPQDDQWLKVLSGCSFTAETWVLLEAEPNLTGKTRVGYVHVGGNWVSVTQEPLPPMPQ